MADLQQEINRRRSFAIISHPDAGKTTLTEKLLHYGGAIQTTGTVKGRKSTKMATSDWMELEQQRGISVTSSVMQFEYKGATINLLDTPGHADFSEDTYRTLTAVDSALMVIDVAKGVEERTIKLMDVCRLRTTPIMTFINKLDREGRDPIELMDEVEEVLKIRCAPMTWPIGMGKNLKGIYRFYDDTVRLFAKRGALRDKALRDKALGDKALGDKALGDKALGDEDVFIKGLANPEVDNYLGADAAAFRDEIELVKGASHSFDKQAYLDAELSPVFFGSALGTLGTDEMLDMFVEYAPAPQGRESATRKVAALENKFTGFVFKIQANMDPSHHDRVAFLRIASGRFEKGMKIKHVRAGKMMTVHNAHTFLAAKRDNAEEAYAGDILGLHNHGTIQIGDTFTEGEDIKYIGVPNFAPELFRRVRLRDPLKAKALQKGLVQLSEEGATQVFKPLISNDLVLGAVGILQFDVVAHRLKHEYGVECSFEAVPIVAARWVEFNEGANETEFKRKNETNLALDGAGYLTYIAPNRANLSLVQDRFPNIAFHNTREV